MTRRRSHLSHADAVTRVAWLLGPQAPTLRSPTWWERVAYRTTGRYPDAYVDARHEWADAIAARMGERRQGLHG